MHIWEKRRGERIKKSIVPKKEILIRKANLEDLQGIFYLYSNYMYESYLLNFGDSFVKEYLKTIIKSANSFTLVSGEKDVNGFIAASFNSKKMFFELLFDIKMLDVLIKRVLSRPYLALQGAALIFYPFKTYLKNVNAELLFIAVKPEYRKRNFAAQLVNEVLNIMKEKGIKKVKVSTVSRNDAVNSLLKKIAFKKERTFKMFKKSMCLYQREISGGAFR